MIHHTRSLANPDPASSLAYSSELRSDHRADCSSTVEELVFLMCWRRYALCASANNHQKNAASRTAAGIVSNSRNHIQLKLDGDAVTCYTNYKNAQSVRPTHFSVVKTQNYYTVYCAYYKRAILYGISNSHFQSIFFKSFEYSNQNYLNLN